MSSQPGKSWTRDELILAINLYCKIPFGTIHIRNPQIIALATLLERTPGSVSYKLANLACIDPALARKGASNVSKLDRAVWEEFFGDWNGMAFESEVLLAEKVRHVDADVQPAVSEELAEYDVVLLVGQNRDAVVKQRVNQGFFRKMVLSSYKNTCCITGLAVPALLNASHIVPWAADEASRTNPKNGLCLNALHDRAFDRGLITVDEKFHVVVSSSVMALKGEKASALQTVHGTPLRMPDRFLPDPDFLHYHRQTIFTD